MIDIQLYDSHVGTARTSVKRHRCDRPVNVASGGLTNWTQIHRDLLG